MFPAAPAPTPKAFASLTEGEDVFVALADRRVLCGVVSIWRSEPFIHLLIVAEAWRGQGIGTALLLHALAELDAPAQLKCGLHNLAARRFYAARGWHEVARIVDDPNPHVLYRSPDAPP